MAENDFQQQNYEEAIKSLDELWELLNMDINLDQDSLMQFYFLEGKVLSDMGRHCEAMQSFGNVCLL